MWWQRQEEDQDRCRFFGSSMWIRIEVKYGSTDPKHSRKLCRRLNSKTSNNVKRKKKRSYDIYWLGQTCGSALWIHLFTYKCGSRSNSSLKCGSGSCSSSKWCESATTGLHSKYPPKLRFEPPCFHYVRPMPSQAPFWASKAPEFWR